MSINRGKSTINRLKFLFLFLHRQKIESIWDLIYFYSSSQALTTKAFKGTHLNQIQLNWNLVKSVKYFGLIL